MKIETSLEFLEENVFKKVYDENAILFLGAGFSFTNDKNYLGSTLVDFYQEKLKVDLETKNLVEFIDRASRLKDFSRNKFDQYVKSLLKSLKPESSHKKVVSMGWRQIITTNMDLLIEDSYSQILGKPEEYKEIVPIRNINEYQSSTSNDQIKYIKLNGCLSDISNYKLIFSSQDFTNNRPFYRMVISNLSSLSNDVCFLSIGYSFTDGLSKQLLDELNKNNLKNEFKVINIDPYPNEAMIPFLEENNIITIKMSTEDFFKYYTKWEEEKYSKVDKKLPKAYFNKNESPVKLDTRLKLRLLNKIVQLHKNNIDHNIKPENFYKGEEPNYSIILGNYDVNKKKLTQSIINSIKESTIKHSLIPVNFVVGSHGIGKSTSAYRAINELQNKENYISFELIDINGLRAQDLESLFDASGSENIIILADQIERNSFFKELMNFRLSLSQYQFNRNIIFLAPIRENILEKYLLGYQYQNINKIPVDHELSKDEIEDLIYKLKKIKLIKVRDRQDEITITEKIRGSYNSDPYVTMLSLIENSTLLRAISDTLSYLNKDAQIAFEYTSLLYQFKIPMPASILKKIINMDWEEFKNNILKVDCKGLLINEVGFPTDIKEDLIFRTKHSIISSKYIKSKFKNEDKLLKRYLRIVHSINPNDEHSKIIIDLLKAIKKFRLFSQKEKLFKLYDEAAKVFLTNPNFNIHYAINLQSRKDIISLNKAAERLRDVDSYSDYRNSAITHRRGVIEFSIAKYYHKQSKFILRDEYLESSKDFFEIKRSIDPFSSFSYYDYIQLEIWKIQNIELSEEEILKQHIIIQDLFLKAYESVVENTDYITKLRSLYVREIKANQFTKAEILNHLEELYNNYDTRALALIFKLNSLENHILDFGNSFLPNLNSDDIIDELSDFSHLDIVLKAIFDYHCKRLYHVDSRMALNQIDSDFFEKDNYFKYHYYSYIKECYNHQFSYAFNHLNKLKKEFKFMNPSLQEEWIDQESLEPKIFKGIIKNENSYKIYINELGKDFFMFKSKIEIKKFQSYYCTIIFTIRGIRVNIISEIVI